jgi:hypothetical protein
MFIGRKEIQESWQAQKKHPSREEAAGAPGASEKMFVTI